MKTCDEGVAGPPGADPPDQTTILLAEDEEMVRRFVCSVLESRGYRVLEARHGEEALLLCADYPGTIHLLLTDLLMPKMGGLGLADRVRGLRPETKVLYISAYSRTDLVPGALELQKAALLRKPFRIAELVGAVARALGQSARPGAEEFGTPSVQPPQQGSEADDRAAPVGTDRLGGG
jgi:CheY-like chemotaxis protein